MNPDLEATPGDPTRMAQVFRVGTRQHHSTKLCWCKPVFKFTIAPDGSLAGAVIHK